MATMTKSMMMTPEQEDLLFKIREQAKKRHEVARKSAAKRGRRDFPDLPFECSWAYEQKFRRHHPPEMFKNGDYARRVLRDMFPKVF